jgi:hypothetical protein
LPAFFLSRQMEPLIISIMPINIEEEKKPYFIKKMFGVRKPGTDPYTYHSGIYIIFFKENGKIDTLFCDKNRCYKGFPKNAKKAMKQYHFLVNHSRWFKMSNRDLHATANQLISEHIYLP